MWNNARVVSAGLSVPTVCELSQIDRQTQTPVPLESTLHHTLAFECDLVIKSTTVQIIAFECDLVIK